MLFIILLDTLNIFVALRLSFYLIRLWCVFHVVEMLFHTNISHLVGNVAGIFFAFLFEYCFLDLFRRFLHVIFFFSTINKLMPNVQQLSCIHSIWCMPKDKWNLFTLLNRLFINIVEERNETMDLRMKKDPIRKR